MTKGFSLLLVLIILTGGCVGKSNQTAADPHQVPTAETVASIAPEAGPATPVAEPAEQPSPEDIAAAQEEAIKKAQNIQTTVKWLGYAAKVASSVMGKSGGGSSMGSEQQRAYDAGIASGLEAQSKFGGITKGIGDALGGLLGK